MAELEPGPELDALVATEVMEWHRNAGTYQPTGWFNKFSLYTEFEDDRSLPCHETGDDPVWSPSTSIADAWQVVEKMQAMNRQKDIHIQCLYDKWDVSMCHFERNGEGMEWGDWTINADTAPHAICLAALKAVEQADG